MIELIKVKKKPEPLPKGDARTLALNMKNQDKGKQKVVEIQINEPHMPSNKPDMSKLDLELEKENKEKEDLFKELEKVENEVEGVETRRNIHFIKSTSSLAS